MKITCTQLLESRQQLQLKKSNLLIIRWPKSITQTSTLEKERTKRKQLKCSRKYTKLTKFYQTLSVVRHMTLKIELMKIMEQLNNLSTRMQLHRDNTINRVLWRISIIQNGLAIKNRNGSTPTTESMFVRNICTERNFTIDIGISLPGSISLSNSSN